MQNIWSPFRHIYKQVLTHHDLAMAGCGRLAAGPVLLSSCCPTSLRCGHHHHHHCTLCWIIIPQSAVTTDPLYPQEMASSWPPSPGRGRSRWWAWASPHSPPRLTAPGDHRLGVTSQLNIIAPSRWQVRMPLMSSYMEWISEHLNTRIFM